MKQREEFLKQREKEFVIRETRRGLEPNYTGHEKQFLRWKLKRKEDSLEKVPSLLDMCCRMIATEIHHFNSDEHLEAIRGLPVPTKEIILEHIALNALRLHASGKMRGTLDDRLLSGLLDSSMTHLNLAFSKCTDYFVRVIEPSAQEQEYSEKFSSWESIFEKPSLEIVGVHQVVSIDLSFCHELSEDVIDGLSESCPALQHLSFAGCFASGENSFLLLKKLGSNLRLLSYLDLSCCSWLSFELMIQADFFNDWRFESLRVLRAECCKEMENLMYEKEDWPITVHHSMERVEVPRNLGFSGEKRVVLLKQGHRKMQLIIGETVGCVYNSCSPVFGAVLTAVP